jgi:hypothetical protein
MASTYVRRFNLKGSLSDQQVGDFWKFLLSEFVPAIQKVKGVNACKVYSGAGALRDCRFAQGTEFLGRNQLSESGEALWKALILMGNSNLVDAKAITVASVGVAFS